MIFSCGHVIPKHQLLPICLAAGPTDIHFNFSFKMRNDERLLNEAGFSVGNFVNVVPGGIVVFFASYTFMDFATKNWEKAGFSVIILGILARFMKKKKVFVEPSTSSECDIVLREYTQVISDADKGGILFAVVGGKMSEGS